LITCNLTKLESAVEQIKKAYPKLIAADASMVASALSLAGRHAKAVYEGEYYVWPTDNERLMITMASHLQGVSDAIEDSAPKKAAKNVVVEEEPVIVNIGLAPNIEAGESLLSSRKDLKTLLSDIIQEGVEYNYGTNDIGWQWALDRTNWSTVSQGELDRRIKVKASFTEGAVGVEQGATIKKPRAKKAE
jgi:hypothetical protein